MVHWAEGTNYSSNKYFFIKSCEILCKNPFILFYKITKMKIKSFECPKFIKVWKKILGISEAWSKSRLSHRPSKPAYCIVDCWILGTVGLLSTKPFVGHSSCLLLFASCPFTTPPPLQVSGEGINPKISSQGEFWDNYAGAFLIEQLYPTFLNFLTESQLLRQNFFQRISEMKTNTGVFVVFKTKNEQKRQFAGNMCVCFLYWDSLTNCLL